MRNPEPPTAERVRELLDYNPKTGVFRWKVKAYRNTTVGAVAGWACRDYRLIRIDGYETREHRVAWLYVHGDWPQHQIEHKNLDRSDNRIGNLREVLIGQNQEHAHTDSHTGFLGVSEYGERYVARIQVDGRNRTLGVFDTPDAAHAAYVAAKRRLHRYWRGHTPARTK